MCYEKMAKDVHNNCSDPASHYTHFVYPAHLHAHPHQVQVCNIVLNIVDKGIAFIKGISNILSQGRTGLRAWENA